MKRSTACICWLAGWAVNTLAEDAPAPTLVDAKKTVVTPATAVEVDEFLASWGKNMAAIRSLEMQFRQEKKLRILRRPKISQGDLAFADGKLSVRTRSPSGEIESELVLRDGELKILYPGLKRLEVIPLGKSGGDPQSSALGAGVSIPFFAGDPRDASKDYEVSLVRSALGDVLTLVPRQQDSPLRRLELRLVAFELREYRQVDRSGDELRMEVQKVELNRTIAPERFQLQVPAGTKVVHPTGK